MKTFLAALAITAALISQGFVYPQTMVVVEVSQTEGLLLETGSRLQYRYFPPENECGDLDVGDLASVILYNAGTPDDVRDDEIMAVRYSGFRSAYGSEKYGIIFLEDEKQFD